MQTALDDAYFDYCPGLRGPRLRRQRAAQDARQLRLTESGAHLGPRCYVSPAAGVFTDTLRLGTDSYIAGHAYVTCEATAGDDCTVNPYATVRGRIALGDGVRIGAHSSLLGFNHGFAPDRPVHRQPLTGEGITVGDDVWIGSHVVVLDGVTIGDHCVVGAGAVVTKDLAPWTVAAGNPARPLRDRRAQGGPRRDRAVSGDLPGGLSDGLPGDRPGEPSGDLGTPSPGSTGPGRRPPKSSPAAGTPTPAATPTGRAVPRPFEHTATPSRSPTCCWGSPPEQLAADEHAARLRALQDPAVDWCPSSLRTAVRALPAPAADGWIDDGTAEYHVLAVGYALDLLVSRLTQPVHVVRRMTAVQLLARLESLPWRTRTWSAGAWVDCWATGAHRNLELGVEDGEPGALEALFGWLTTRVDPWTGMWGTAGLPAAGRLQLVNGYYRLTRAPTPSSGSMCRMRSGSWTPYWPMAAISAGSRPAGRTPATCWTWPIPCGSRDGAADIGRPRCGRGPRSS